MSYELRVTSDVCEVSELIFFLKKIGATARQRWRQSAAVSRHAIAAKGQTSVDLQDSMAVPPGITFSASFPPPLSSHNHQSCLPIQHLRAQSDWRASKLSWNQPSIVGTCTPSFEPNCSRPLAKIVGTATDVRLYHHAVFQQHSYAHFVVDAISASTFGRDLAFLGWRRENAVPDNELPALIALIEAHLKQNPRGQGMRRVKFDLGYLYGIHVSRYPLPPSPIHTHDAYTLEFATASYFVNRINSHRVAAIMAMIDPTGPMHRLCWRTQRRLYISPGPNYAWHVDGWDKLKLPVIERYKSEHQVINQRYRSGTEVVENRKNTRTSDAFFILASARFSFRFCFFSSLAFFFFAALAACFASFSMTRRAIAS